MIRTAMPGPRLHRADLLGNGRSGGRGGSGARVRRPAPPPAGRPVLRLVPPLEEPTGGGDGPPDRVDLARIHPKRRPRQPVRLTRRGRVVVTVFVLALVGALVLLLASPGAAAPPTGAAPRSVVVHRGDTLWSLAVWATPHRPVLDTMRAIEQLNRLPDGLIRVGQQLLVPGPG